MPIGARLRTTGTGATLPVLTIPCNVTVGSSAEGLVTGTIDASVQSLMAAATISGTGVGTGWEVSAGVGLKVEVDVGVGERAGEVDCVDVESSVHAIAIVTTIAVAKAPITRIMDL